MASLLFCLNIAIKKGQAFSIFYRKIHFFYQTSG